MKDLKTTILEQFKTNDKIRVKYYTSCDDCNEDFTTLIVGDYEHKISGKDYNIFTKEIKDTIKQIGNIYSEIHTNSRIIQIDRYYPGFNSVEHENLIVEICRDGKEIIKKHEVKYKCNLTGISAIDEVLKKFPCNEFYYRFGFAFRGSNEGKLSNLEELKKRAKEATAIDIEIIDDELHVNGFSCNDLY